MQTLVIPSSNIVVDKADPTQRTFHKSFCENLARSIESEGLLHDPIVQPIANKPGFYRVLAGRNRVYACVKILKWASVPCKVGPDNMTDSEAKAIEIAENLWRNPLNEEQVKKALIDWERIYAAAHPLVADTKGLDAKRGAETRRRVEEAKAKGEKVDEAKVAAQVAAETKPFSKVIEETLKVSPSLAARLARVAKNLEKEQIDVLAKKKVTEEHIDRLASLGEREAISKAVNLIASGMDHEEAIRVAGKPLRDQKEAEARAKQEKKAARPAPTREQKAAVPRAPAKPREAQLTDDEWLVAHCDHILKVLKRQAAYKRDAILYRRIIEPLSRFRATMKKPLAEAKSSGGNGAFFSVLSRLTRASHPSDWPVCGVCNGQGYILGPGEDGKECKKTCAKCFGAAYLLKFED